MLEEIEELKVVVEVMAIEQRCTFVRNQLRHVIYRRHGGPLLGIFEVINDLLVDIEGILFGQATMVPSRPGLSCPRIPVQRRAGDDRA